MSTEPRAESNLLIEKMVCRMDTYGVKKAKEHSGQRCREAWGWGYPRSRV